MRIVDTAAPARQLRVSQCRTAAALQHVDVNELYYYTVHWPKFLNDSDSIKSELCDNYRVSGALEKLEHETNLQDRAADR